jgi:hypothetical protein
MAFLSFVFLQYGGAPAWKTVIKISVFLGVIIAVFLLFVGAMGVGVVENSSKDTDTKL